MSRSQPEDDGGDFVLRSRVPDSAVGMELGRYIAERFRYRSHADWCASIEAGDLTVNDCAVRPTHRLARGDRLAYLQRARVEPTVPRDVRIVHDAADHAVAYKPGGLPTHADGAFVRSTFVRLIAAELGLPRVLLVHRLDRETSGLMVVAKTSKASANLHRQFEARTVGKRYLALARGVVAKDRFVVDGAIARDVSSQVSVRRCVVAAGGVTASTEVEVIARGATATALRVTPRTGRAHQIRVHLESVGHALVGDKLYGREDADFLAWVEHVKQGGDPAWDDRFGAARHALHAAELAFDDPTTGRRFEFFEPWPDDLRELARAAQIPLDTDVV